MDHLFILGTIALTVYGQMVLKWQVGQAGPLPPGLDGKLLFITRLLLNPWVWSSLLAAFLASLTWMAALSRFEISYAYPFMSLAFVLVLALSVVAFRESLTLPKAAGMACVVIGLVFASRG